MKTEARSAGDRAEDRALAYFEGLGWKLIERNFLCKAGEVDLILEDPKGTVVFVEVKYRANLAYGAPQEFVGGGKQVKMGRAALFFIKSKGFKFKSGNYRFDVAAAGPETLEHIENAFSFDNYTL
ncbi:MAG: YraN family protein [Elusimicrobia bacterium RIFCSPLOWO2_01_FULL_60_11]|nr:MAG: YraN family protein [Elusimicrobia bacterium RIFCSPLOWO2_01_FULL_60_11]